MMMKTQIKNLKIWSLNSIRSLNKDMQQFLNNFKINFETSFIETISKEISKKMWWNNDNLTLNLFETSQLLLKNQLKSPHITQHKVQSSWVLICIKLCQLRILKRNMKRLSKNMTLFELKSQPRVFHNLNQILILNKLKLMLQ